MFRRLVVWAVRSYIGGPARSWVFTSMALMAMRLVRSVRGRRELIDLSSVGKGETIIIEQLPISHKRQMKEMRRDKRQARRARREAGRQG